MWFIYRKTELRYWLVHNSLIHSNEGLMLETSAFKSLYSGRIIKLVSQCHIINSVNKTKLSLNTPHQRSTTVFFRNLPPSYIKKIRPPSSKMLGLWAPWTPLLGACLIVTPEVLQFHLVQKLPSVFNTSASNQQTVAKVTQQNKVLNQQFVTML